MSPKTFFIVLGLFFIGLGIRSIVTKTATWRTKLDRPGSSLGRSDETEGWSFTGPMAVLIGIVEIIIGAAVMISGFKHD